MSKKHEENKDMEHNDDIRDVATELAEAIASEESAMVAEVDEATQETDGSDTSQDQASDTDESSEDSDERLEVFPRPVVEQLRKENAARREKARDAQERADAYAKRLHTALVRLDGRLSDPEALPFDEAHLDDPDALAGAVDELVAKRPELKARQAAGDIGAGKRGTPRKRMDLLEALRGLA